MHRTVVIAYSATKITITISLGDVTLVVEIPISPDRLPATFIV